MLIKGCPNFSYWLRLSKKSGVIRSATSAVRKSGHLFLRLSGCVQAFWLFQLGGLKFLGINQAIKGCGGGLVVWLASLFRFCTVAISRNSSRAPVRPLSLSLTIARICLASPKSASIFLRSTLEAA